mmetsp:Transcript_170173/g.413677  ORF Transcript_170173/g.413677 Transcript_170173/m.413677 type:complete len:231 (-) Transcript_170173:1926-2618(-)
MEQVRLPRRRQRSILAALWWESSIATLVRCLSLLTVKAKACASRASRARPCILRWDSMPRTRRSRSSERSDRRSPLSMYVAPPGTRAPGHLLGSATPTATRRSRARRARTPSQCSALASIRAVLCLSSSLMKTRVVTRCRAWASPRSRSRASVTVRLTAACFVATTDNCTAPAVRVQARRFTRTMLLCSTWIWMLARAISSSTVARRSFSSSQWQARFGLPSASTVQGAK